MLTYRSLMAQSLRVLRSCQYPVKHYQWPFYRRNRQKHYDRSYATFQEAEAVFPLFLYLLILCHVCRDHDPPWFLLLHLQIRQ